MMGKELIKYFIIVSIILGEGIFLSHSLAAVETERKEKPIKLEEFGSMAELYKSLSPEMSFEEYSKRELEARERVVKKKAGEDAQRSFQDLTTALQIMFRVRERVRAIERRRAEFFIKPVRNATPGKSVDEKGAVTFTGTNIQVAKYILRKYAKEYSPDISDEDLKEAERRLDETAGSLPHKGFSITFKNWDADKVGNITRIPIQVAVRDENTHFLNWSFSKAIIPRYAEDKEGNPLLYYDYTYNYVKYLESTGDWWGFNNKFSNAFGWAVRTYQETLNLKTGMLTTLEQSINEMDLSLREPIKYHRKVNEIFGDINYSYEEDVRVLEYYTTFDEDNLREPGAKKYLPKIIEVTRYNDPNIPDARMTSREYYVYDDDRIVNSLTVSRTESLDGRYRFNSIRINKVLSFDPLTKLVGIESTLFEIPFLSGSFEQALEYGEVIWQAMQDEEVMQAVRDSADNYNYEIVWEIAKEVMGGSNYQAAKINVLARYNLELKKKGLELVAQSLTPEAGSEVVQLLKQLQELERIYGTKVKFPPL